MLATSSSPACVLFGIPFCVAAIAFTCTPFRPHLLYTGVYSFLFSRVVSCLPLHSAVGTERMGAYLLTYFTQSQHVAPQISADVGYGLGQGGG